MNPFLRALLLCIIMPLFSVAQNNYVRITQIGSSKNSSVNITRMDNAGNAYFVINSTEDIEVRGMTYRKRGTNYSVIAKIAANGSQVWTRAYIVNTGADVVSDLQVDKDQNIYLAGTGDNVMLDNGTTLNPGPFLIKLNKAGDVQWSIGPDADQKDVGTPGLIALDNEGLYWSAGFVKRLRIQSSNISATDPASTIAEAFVARVTPAGEVAGVYHHPMSGALVQVLKTTNTGHAVAVINGDGGPVKLLVGKDGKKISQGSFFRYAGSNSTVWTTPYGYQLFGYDRESTGYYDVRLDDQLNVSSANKVFAMPGSMADRVAEGIGFDTATAFYTRGGFAGQVQDWLVNDKGTPTTLPPEKPNDQGLQTFTRSFMQVVGDTVNMLVRHNDPGQVRYSFYDKTYVDRAAGTDGYFWVKYLYKPTDPCLKLIATVVKNGIEGGQDAVIRVSLPDNCVAAEDLTVGIKLADGFDNAGDFVLPAPVVVKKGMNSTEAIINVTNDNEFESDEHFDVQLTLAPTTASYKIASGATLTFSIADNDNTAANRVFNVTYQPEVREGASGTITVSLLPNIKLGEPLEFIYQSDASPYSATSGADHNPILITLPAGSNSVTYNVNALEDKLIEGDEFISGKIIAKSTTYGQFTSADDNIKINIVDADNTVDNRIIDITSTTTTLREGSSNTFLFKIASPYSVQYPLNINSAKVQWLPFLQQNNTSVQLSQASVTAALTFTYPTDNVIRNDEAIKLGLTAIDPHMGTFRFRWNGQIVDMLNMTAADDDLATAKLIVSPSVLSLREGFSGNVNIQVAGNKIFDADVTIAYNWGGSNIAADKRITDPSVGGITLPKEQNKLIIPVSVSNDKQINANNNYSLNFTATDAAGKAITLDPRSIAVNIIDDDATSLKIPMVFTPNGDGINDRWNIEGLSLDERAQVTVFDRGGGLIYQSTGYGMPWDGTAKGSPLPAGTYYYKINGFSHLHAGSVTIIR
ncbi:T9SS type B sorting domain-containing protein [Mucilaginibacter myungsuensis]|uniref:Gliding motility-associated C-terminal domain-containing protein n=1 Tax=Mucilaginibacter myungsuensis TaxID=649104 RepID=A0A929PYK5_9SPHI|nr:gliding motility-associated C-terminal domain-containing protein [Mucilaginibacter myungsuensis]MBE9664264.1 gliding motility-associated C-terminal domain-containing protein [Mucilaginibacter myungsuensis]MDN3599968.1 gliding motility-associated C-terminal domain-containing protein [Mucilaginibacter myungsuensis]